RELENVLERTILFCSDNRIEESDLPADQPADSSGRADDTAVPTDTAAPAEPISGVTPLKEAVRAKTYEVEKELIAKALDETGGNVTKAAKLLKISRKSLQMKMKEFGLRDREGGA
ncbi:MAG: helix-turn-helix domain-containing protein, partial [Myxococcota bacterium]